MDLPLKGRLQLWQCCTNFASTFPLQLRLEKHGPFVFGRFGGGGGSPFGFGSGFGSHFSLTLLSSSSRLDSPQAR
jgi:hypothetical protein